MLTENALQLAAAITLSSPLPVETVGFPRIDFDGVRRMTIRMTVRGVVQDVEVEHSPNDETLIVSVVDQVTGDTVRYSAACSRTLMSALHTICAGGPVQAFADDQEVDLRKPERPASPRETLRKGAKQK